MLLIHDYYSQLWSPHRIGNIQSLELLQWSFIRKIDGSKKKDYWECLKWLHMYSLQCRRERYQIIYTWKIIEGLVPDFGNTVNPATSWYISQRRGRLCNIPNVHVHVRHSVQSKMYASLSQIGPRLFNALPKELRNLTNTKVETLNPILISF